MFMFILYYVVMIGIRQNFLIFCVCSKLHLILQEQLLKKVQHNSNWSLHHRINKYTCQFAICRFLRAVCFSFLFSSNAIILISVLLLARFKKSWYNMIKHDIDRKLCSELIKLFFTSTKLFISLQMPERNTKFFKCLFTKWLNELGT